MTPVAKMLALTIEHGLDFHNVPVVDNRPDIKDRKTSRSYFSHPAWGEVDVDTSDGDKALATLQAWIGLNRPEPEDVTVDEHDLTVKPKTKKKAKKK